MALTQCKKLIKLITLSSHKIYIALFEACLTEVKTK
jgi:hypothetical protein